VLAGVGDRRGGPGVAGDQDDRHEEEERMFHGGGTRGIIAGKRRVMVRRVGKKRPRVGLAGPVWCWCFSRGCYSFPTFL
jgi:hypothetical protein